ncbi:hypothetical protein [Pseudoduganella umbonata]|uniref:Uncharacterized protein n=1 Tax=Pseudoduganella umbonata TaxID=864828 RepID=A0A4P8HIT3_9BURK|nr:hypothetical protein [Pseudoduganella umbonata]MBB3219325.1 hypothetical protein [Pseudoduganella umbonata]QCP09427.1 hypothetical protein FCL38_02560 [Pseudoduganella umbonata]
MINTTKSLLAASLLSCCGFASSQVSITVGQPGFYGRIDIGHAAPPPLLYDEPIIVERPVRVIREPLYLRVPPGHAKNWRKHCSKYRACGRRVLFVRDDWYLNDYAPRYRAEHRDRQDRHDGRDRNDSHQRHERQDHDRGHPGKGHGHGNGNGNGNGNGKGHGRD